MHDVSYPLAFLAGLLSFLSPCVLPLVPAYVSFISGLSLDELRHTHRFTKGLRSTVAFVLGFSSIFMALGASSSLLGTLFVKYQNYIRIGGGVLVIVFGIFSAGFLKLDFLMRERRLHLEKHPAGLVGAFLIGIAFAAGWTPCIGPILGTILIYAGSEASASYGMKLLAVYSMGLAVPFILSTMAINIFFSYTRKLQKFMRGVSIVSGLVLIAFGIILLTNSLGWLASLFPNLEIRM
ncbi:MAG TPA: cytochrome c biogenesis protein CcdA [Dissulfurispiraceae bacterium]|nr:cytochrome c biogenesis protein CcdA [Dissulfurispiraceae bacterium]